MGRVRRKFDAEFKLEIVRQIMSGEFSQSKVCRDHQLSQSVVKRWMESFNCGETFHNKPTAKEKLLEIENSRLKAKVGELVMQIDHLKKLDEFVRLRRRENTSVVTPKNLKRSLGGAK